MYDQTECPPAPLSSTGLGLFIPLATSHTLKLDHSDRRHFHASQDWILDFFGSHTLQLDTVHFGVYHIASFKRFLCHTAAGFLF